MSRLVVTLTANPSIDRTITLTGPLERGAVLRAASSLDQPGGKGVNISRAAVAAGLETVAVVPADHESEYLLELSSAGLPCHAEHTTGPVRVNLTLTEPDGTTTKVNAPGAGVDADLLERLFGSVLELAERAAWVVLAGSLPPGAPEDWYAEVATALASGPARVAVDTSDAPLAALASRLGSARPDLLKPNAEELASVTGSPVTDPTEAAKAAQVLLNRGAHTVLATLGSQGAVLVDDSGAWHATPPPIRVASTVGAGDSSLFGYLLGDLRGASPAERLSLAVAYGAAAAALPGTTIPAPDQVHPELVETRRLS